MDTWFCRQSVGPPLENGLQPTTQVTRIKLAIVMLEANAANVILSEYTSFFWGGGGGGRGIFRNEKDDQQARYSKLLKPCSASAHTATLPTKTF